MHRLEETLAALATPHGEGALAIVRVSGPKAREALLALASPSPRPLRERYLHRVDLVDAEGLELDEATAVWMPGPRSFTGEDSVEFILHGGPLVARRVLDALFSCGLRQAEPGEFSYRALVHGRMDLTQAEALADLIHSRSEAERRLALSHLGGALSRRIAPLRDELLVLLRDLEAGLDFAEEDIDFVTRPRIEEGLARLRAEARSLLAGAEQGRLVREGLSVVIAGEPNVGKSSLFNALLQEERALVTETPGTTRDALRESLIIGGLIFHLHDTAGLRETGEQVERLGVERSEDLIRRAQITLWVADGTRGPSEGERTRMETLDPSSALLLRNKRDLPGFDAARLPVPPGLRAMDVSARTGEGIEALKSALLGLATRGRGAEALEMDAALNRRQEARLTALVALLEEMTPLAVAAMEAEILAARLREAYSELEGLAGDRVGEVVLDEIFSKFCVGK